MLEKFGRSRGNGCLSGCAPVWLSGNALVSMYSTPHPVSAWMGDLSLSGWVNHFPLGHETSHPGLLSLSHPSAGIAK